MIDGQSIDVRRSACATEPRYVVCPYCGEEARLADSAEVYSRSYGMIWICVPCRAWVGVHKGDGKNRPLGRLANAELREWKMRAHAAFDPMWKAKVRRDECSKGRARGAGYKWLAEKLGVPVDECHIGMFDVDVCRRVVEVCRQRIMENERKQGETIMDIRIDDARCIAETERAICIEAPEFDEPQWVPQSQITADSEVWRRDDEGVLVVTEWIAGQKGWI